MFGKGRSVDDLSAEELERALLIKKRAERAERLRRLAGDGRLVTSDAEGTEPPADSGRAAPGSQRKAGMASLRPLKPETPKRPKAQINLRRVRDRFLLFVEVAALIGLIAILVNVFFDLRELNKDVVEAATGASEPTPTATALIELQALPGGHEPPVEGQEPVPAQYRHLITPVTPVPIPTPGPEQPTRVVISKINVDARVVEGDSWEQLRKGVGHHIGSANPGERGNCVISGHDDIYGEIFKDLGKLELEDEIVVYTGVQPYRYRVVAKRIIEPTEVQVMDPTPDPVLTLITCYPYRIDTHRLVIIAALVQ